MRRRNFIKNMGSAGGVLMLGAGTTSFMAHRQSGLNEMKALQGVWPISEANAGVFQSEVKLYNSKPTLFIGGKPHFPMAFLSYYPKQYRYKRMHEAGMNFFSLSITLGDGFYAGYRQGKVSLGKKGIWDAPGKIDYDLFDQSILEIVEVAPDAYIFPRIYCDAPGWWSSFHPAEVNRSFSGAPQRQSFSSLVWRQEISEILRNIVRHIWNSSYAAKIVGIHVTAGETEESVPHNWAGPCDYSIVSKKRFRQWLLKKYNQNDGQIKFLFNKDIDEIEVPTPEERDKCLGNTFYNPEISRLAIDYQFFKCDEIVDSLETLCKAVKDESEGKLFTGVFYGYTLAEWRDHYALHKILRSPYIDFLSCTNGAGKNTAIGDHDMHFITETDSIQKAGKLFYYEADTRTSMSKWISQLQPEIDPYNEYDLPNWLGPDTVEKSTELLKAVFSRVICTGSANWWFDLWGGWYDHEKIQSQFKEMQKIGDESIHLPRESVAEVCVLVSEKSLLHVAASTRKNTWVGSQMHHLGKIGTPYDIFLIDDLKTLDSSKYKLFIFLNAIFLDQETRLTVQEKCAKNECTLMWMYAPGLINENISVDQVSSLVNMEIKLLDKNPETEIKISFKDQISTYKSAEISPFVFISSGADTAIGQTEHGYVVLGEKKEKNYTTILCCAPPVPWSFIQYAAMKAGVHIYSTEGNVVYANQSYLSVSSLTPGRKKISLPGDCQLVELFSNSGNTYKFSKEHEIDFSAGSCRFFKVVNKHDSKKK